MFDLAIKTTLEKTLAAYSPWFLRQLPCLRDLRICDFASFGKGVSELCSLDYSGGLSRDLSVISRWDSRSNLDVSRRNQVVIFLRELCVLRYLRDPGNEEVRFLRSTIRSRRLGDQLVREFVSS
ncbi:hypothetical protein GQ457_04G012490 [Hibiscus cannabinus]